MQYFNIKLGIISAVDSIIKIESCNFYSYSATIGGL